jgi:hypothetical protein
MRPWKNMSEYLFCINCWQSQKFCQGSSPNRDWSHAPAEYRQLLSVEQTCSLQRMNKDMNIDTNSFALFIERWCEIDSRSSG